MRDLSIVNKLALFWLKSSQQNQIEITQQSWPVKKMNRKMRKIGVEQPRKCSLALQEETKLENSGKTTPFPCRLCILRRVSNDLVTLLFEPLVFSRFYI